MTKTARPTRVAVYGGSFNPPHVGHLMVASWVLWTRRADEVWWSPSYSHPFGKDLAPFEARVNWLRALLREHPGMSVCTAESEISAPSYTVDLLDYLSAQRPELSFRLLVGADNLDDLHRWKDSGRLQDAYHPIVVGRVGYPCEHDTVEFPGVSSTEVRRRLADGLSVEHLVPASILDSVRAFYSAATSGGPKPSHP